MHAHAAIDVDATGATSNPATVGMGRQGLVLVALVVAFVVAGTLLAATAPRERPFTDVTPLQGGADRSLITKSD